MWLSVSFPVSMSQSSSLLCLQILKSGEKGNSPCLPCVFKKYAFKCVSAHVINMCGGQKTTLGVTFRKAIHLLRDRSLFGLG